MKNLTFKAAMLKGSQPTVNRRSTDGQSQRHCKQTPLSKRWKVLMTLVFLFTFAIGNVWAAVYKTYALSDLTYTSATLTYEVTGLSSSDQKLNKGERKVEVPCATASGTLYLSGTGANADRYASIWGTNGTAVDDTRKIAMTSGYGSGISFTSDDILTDGEKYYIVFGNVSGSDYKINAFKYVLSAACPSGDDTTAPTLSSSNPANSATDVAIEGTIVLTFSEAIASVDGTKFSLSGATIGTVAKDGSDSKKVNVPYTGAANEATVTLSVAAEAVADAAGNKSAALSAISFTTVAAVTPVCPSGVTISGTAAYTAGETIELTAALSEGNGEITYNWYKGADLATAKAAGSIGTGTSFSKASCATSDAGNYWCVASKDACPDAESAAYAVTVAAVSYCAELYPATSGASPTGKNQELLLQSEAPNASYGGKIYTAGAKSDNWSASFTYGANGLSLNKGGADSARVELTHLMKVGTVITATLVNPDAEKARGYKLLNMAKTTKATWQATTTDPQVYTYTVVEGDGLAGTNMFLLQRAETSALKELKVSNCGAELLALSSAVTPAHDPAYATVTLSKSLVAVGGTATATYSAIDAAYDFDEWVVSGATIDDAKANPVTITMGSTAATITLKLKAASVKHTVTYYDGATELGTEQVEEGSNPTGAGLTPKKQGYTFGGWSLTNGGDAIASYASVTVDENKDLFAVWTQVVCPASGTIFAFEMNESAKPGSEVKAPQKDILVIDEYLTITGQGSAIIGNTTNNTNQYASVKTDPKISLSGATGYLQIALECALQAGDVITIAKNNTQIYISDEVGTSGPTGNKYTTATNAENTIVVGANETTAAWVGAMNLYFWYKGGSVSITSVSVTRPAKHTLAWNFDGGNTTSTTHTAAGQVVEGAAITYPANNTMSKDGYTFSGWSTDVTEMPTSDLTITALWTAWPTMTLNRGAATSGDDVVTSVEPGSVVTVPACPFSYTDYNFNGWAYSPAVTMVDETHFTMPSENLTLTAQWVDANNVAQIGSTKYATFAEALAHAADGEIVLLQDINVDAQIEVAAGVSATLDLAGHKIEYTGSTTLTSGVILIHNGGSLTINDSSDPDAGSIFSGDKAYAAVALTKLGDDPSTPATLVVNGGALTGYYYGITGNGSRNNTDITINGGTITGTVGIAIYHPQVGTLTVNNGSLTGEDAAIEMRAGTLVINDGTFTATATEFSCNPNGSGSTTSGAAIAIAQHTTKKDIEVTINGGTFNGVKALNESNPQVNDPAPQVTMAVTAGTFTGEVSTVDVHEFISGGSFSEPVAEANCATGYVPETKANGKYGVIVPAQSIDFEAIIDTYGTDATAIAELDAQLAAKHYDIDGTLNDDRLDAPSGKPADKGFKVKKTDLTISFSVEAGKVVEITTGSLSGASIKVNDAAAVAMTASHTHTYYSDDAQAFLITMTAASNKYNIFKSIVIRDPYQVTLDATTNGGEAVAPMYGKLSVTLPSAVKGTDHFIGWYDIAEEEGSTLIGLAGAEYTPTSDITLYAHYAAQSNDATLASWEIDGVDTPVPTEPGNLIHRINVPYGTAVSALPKITAAVAHDATYAQSVVIYPTDGPEWQAGIDGGCYVQQVIVTAEDGTQGFYHVRTKVLPKDMACLIKATVTGDNAMAIDASASIYEGTESIYKVYGNAETYEAKSAPKFQSNGYLGVTLTTAGAAFQQGDVVRVFATKGIDNVAKLYVYSDNTGTAAKQIAESETALVKGYNEAALTAAGEGATSVFLCRAGQYTSWNPCIYDIAVYRAYPNPLVNTITFNGAAGTVDNDLKTITVEVPASTDYGTMPVVATFLSNDPSLTSGAVTGSWAEGDNEYVVTDKDNDQTVYTVTITKAVPSSDATLSALSYGTPATAIALADGVYEYDVELPYGTSAVPALAATAHHAGANVTDIDDAAAFVNRHATSTVTVTAENGTTTQLYTVNFTVSRFESKVLWDGSTMTDLSEITAAATAAGVTATTTGISVTSFSAKTCEENGKSYTRALNIGGNTKSTRYFAIEIPAGKVAKVSLVYKANGNDARSIIIGTALASVVDESAITVVEKENDQLLHVMTAEMFGGGTLYINTTNGFQVHEISLQLADGFARSSMLGAGVLGTVCVPNNVAIEDIQGVTVYELMGRDYNNYGKLAFDEIISGELEAGAPYVFVANGNHMALLYGATHVDNPVDKGNGMYGTFTDQTLTELDDVYYFAQRALWSCDGLASLSLPANRAYVKLSEIGEVSSPTPNPARRRITMAVNGEKVATGIDNLEASEKPLKLMIDGQMYILRGEKLFDATGRLVK